MFADATLVRLRLRKHEHLLSTLGCLGTALDVFNDIQLWTGVCFLTRIKKGPS